MAKKPDSTAPPKPKRVVILDEAEPDRLRAVGGSSSDRFNYALINSMTATSWFPPGQSDEDYDRQCFVAVTALRAFKPTDEIEGMIAAQAVALHHAAMDCFRRVVIAGQPAEVASKLRKDGANLARAMTDMLGALDRKRGKGQQVVRVEHVHVHPGGQAIVGNVKAGDTAAVTKPAPPLARRRWRSVRSGPASPWTASSANSRRWWGGRGYDRKSEEEPRA